MFAELILVSTMSWQVTSYRSVPEQTDSTPFHTSIGTRVRKGICAVSRDVVNKQDNGLLQYGDVVWVEVVTKPELSRFCMVADTMNKRHTYSVDFWVATHAEEASVNVQRGRVYKLSKNPSKTLNRELPLTTKANRASRALRANKPLRVF